MSRNTTFSLRLLIAPRCQNTTAQGLAEALACLPNLAYLDLSNTLAVRDKSVLAKLSNLPLLQVLKLGSVQLRDEDLTVLAQAVGTRLRSLDVRGNRLTDESIRELLDHCFVSVDVSNRSPRAHGRYPSPSEVAVEDWPFGVEQPDSAILDGFQDESYDDMLVWQLTSHTVTRVPFEDLPHSGITHLRISDNKLSVEGVAALVRSKRLCVLDVGSIIAEASRREARLNSAFFSGAFDDGHIRLFGVQKLASVLGLCAQSITSLRIDHTLLTETTPPEECTAPSTFCGFRINEDIPELEATVPLTHEAVDHQPPSYAIENQDVIPTYELPGHLNYSAHQQTNKEPRTFGSNASVVRPGDGSTPEDVREPSKGDDVEQPVLGVAGLPIPPQAMNGINGVVSRPNNFRSTNRPSAILGDLEMDIAFLQKQRAEFRKYQASNVRGITPGMMPNLRTIVLTDVPCYEPTPRVIDALIHFIKGCAAEAEFRALQTRLVARSAPKAGRVRSSRHRRSLGATFALHRIVLEMAHHDPSIISPTLSPCNGNPSSFANRTKSSFTHDADSEALWAASKNDFSFFDPDKQCVLPTAETADYLPNATSSVETRREDASGYCLPSPRRHQSKGAPIDVVTELARFRTERKAAYNDAQKKGLEHVDGYWPGDVIIVKSQSSFGMMEYNGNGLDRSAYR